MKIYVVKDNCYTKGSCSPLHNMSIIVLITLSKKKAYKKIEELKRNVNTDVFENVSGGGRTALYLNRNNGILLEFAVDTYTCNVFGRKGKEIYE